MLNWDYSKISDGGEKWTLTDGLLTRVVLVRLPGTVIRAYWPRGVEPTDYPSFATALAAVRAHHPEAGPLPTVSDALLRVRS